MTIDFDTKGKIFTTIISKESIPAIIQTIAHRIEGEVHVRQGGRFKDELEIDEPFLAVTNATVMGADQQVLYRTHFIAIRREHVVWALPLHEIHQEG